MEFLIQLARKGDDTVAIDVRDLDHDSLEGTLDQLCGALAETGALEFVVGGFGDARWPVDVHTDLSVALEQLPALAEAIAERREGRLDFYEQGIERMLVFRPEGELIRIVCSSETSWHPTPESVLQGRVETLQMLSEFSDAFWNLLTAIAPAARQNSRLQAWRRGTEALHACLRSEMTN